MASVHELLTQKREYCDAANVIRDRVYDEQNGEWRGDDQAKFDDLLAKAEAKQGEIERMSKLDAAIASLDERKEAKRAVTTDYGKTSQQSTYAGKVTEQDRAEALRAWMLAGVPDEPLTDKQRETAQRTGMNLNVQRLRMSFGPVLRDVSPEGVKVWRERMMEQRAALTGAQSTTTTGGYTVPDEAMRALEVSLLAFGGMRAVADVVRTSSGGPLPWPTTNDTANKGEIIGENTSQNELEMTFGQLVLDAYKYTSKYILASVEFLQDTSINVGEFLGEALANRIGRITNDHFTTGSGSSQPNGVVTASSAGVSSVADPPTYDNFVDLVHSIDPAYRTNARFMMNDTTLKSIKKIKILQYSGDAVGVPLWQPSMVVGQPDSILGYSYVINQSMANPGSSAKKVLFGDFSKYKIRDVRDFTLLRLDERFAELGQVAFLAFSRHDGDLLDAGTDPVKHMAQA